MLRAVLHYLKRGGGTPCLRELAVAGPLQGGPVSAEEHRARIHVLHALLTEAPALTRLDVADEAWCDSEQAC